MTEEALFSLAPVCFLLLSTHICHKVSSRQHFLPQDLCTCFSSHPLHLWLIF